MNIIIWGICPLFCASASYSDPFTNSPKSLHLVTRLLKLMAHMNTIIVINYLLGIVNAQPGNIYTFAGERNLFGDGGSISSTPLYNPTGVVVSPNGDIYISDQRNYGIRKVFPPLF